jgi:hypothetical protein
MRCPRTCDPPLQRQHSNLLPRHRGLVACPRPSLQATRAGARTAQHPPSGHPREDHRKPCTASRSRPRRHGGGGHGLSSAGGAAGDCRRTCASPASSLPPCSLAPQKNILGLVQGAAARIDLEFKTDKGQPYKKTAPVKGKTGEVEELPLFTNKDDLLGEVSDGQPSCMRPEAPPSRQQCSCLQACMSWQAPRTQRSTDERPDSSGRPAGPCAAPGHASRGLPVSQHFFQCPLTDPSHSAHNQEVRAHGHSDPSEHSLLQQDCVLSAPAACDTHAHAYPMMSCSPCPAHRSQLIGQIELASERGTPHDFVSLGEGRTADTQLGDSR